MVSCNVIIKVSNSRLGIAYHSHNHKKKMNRGRYRKVDFQCSCSTNRFKLTNEFGLCGIYTVKIEWSYAPFSEEMCKIWKIEYWMFINLE